MKKCNRCDELIGDRWESSDGATEGLIFLNKCSCIFSDFNPEGGRQAWEGVTNHKAVKSETAQHINLEWGNDQYRLCWNCNKNLISTIGSFFMNNSKSNKVEDKVKMSHSRDLKEVECAIDWWADVVQAPKNDNGDGMQSALMGLLASKTAKPTVDQIKIFKSFLKECIYDFWEKHNLKWDLDNPDFGCGFRTLSTDYHPDGVLSDAAKLAGISTNLFPCKTVMWIKPGSVQVSYGYRAPLESLYSADKSTSKESE